MARPLRIEFPGAIYYITNRGNSRQNIFLHEDDRIAFLQSLNQAAKRHHWLCHAYCLMSNHYHLLVETEVPSLSKGMKYINGTYTQTFNRKHEQTGHLFQGRFNAILVERDAYLLELCRYIVLNPVRVGMVRSAKDWPWSSYRATAGQAEPIEALAVDWILNTFDRNIKTAQQLYRSFVSKGRDEASPWNDLKSQIYLGSDNFIRSMQRHIGKEQSLQDIPESQILAPKKPLAYYEKQYRKRNQAMAEAYRSGHFTLKQVGDHFGVSYATVSRVLKKVGV